MTRDVFISHAGDDASVAIEVCAQLEKRGLKCWMAPRDVAAGSVWDEAILDAIETSRVFLLILSKSANQSQFVKNEVNRAFSQSKPIVTFRLEDVPPGARWNYIWRGITGRTRFRHRWERASSGWQLPSPRCSIRQQPPVQPPLLLPLLLRLFGQRSALGFCLRSSQ